MPSFINKDLESTKTTLTSQGMTYTILGTGNKVIKQYPEKGDTITNKDTIYLITNDQNLMVPNVTGLSSKVANSLLSLLGIKVNLDGIGYVTAQSIPESTPITEGLEITLTLSPKFSSS